MSLVKSLWLTLGILPKVVSEIFKSTDWTNFMKMNSWVFLMAGMHSMLLFRLDGSQILWPTIYIATLERHRGPSLSQQRLPHSVVDILPIGGPYCDLPLYEECLIFWHMLSSNHGTLVGWIGSLCDYFIEELFSRKSPGDFLGIYLEFKYYCWSHCWIYSP